MKPGPVPAVPSWIIGRVNYDDAVPEGSTRPPRPARDAAADAPAVPDHDPGGVALQIDEIRDIGATEMTVTVRNLRGPVRQGARFHRLSGRREPVDLQLVRILWYGRPVGELPAAHTALVTLRGAGLAALRSGSLTDGWQGLGGRNPPA